MSNTVKEAELVKNSELKASGCKHPVVVPINRDKRRSKAFIKAYGRGNFTSYCKICGSLFEECFVNGSKLTLERPNER